MMKAGKISAAPVSDELLIARFLDGDDLAFSAIFSRHSRKVAGLAYRLMGDDAEIDDIVQETFIQVARSLRKIKDPGRLRWWIWTIAIRQVRRHLRKRIVMRALSIEARRVFPVVDDPRNQLKLKELYEVLDQLPSKLRIPWILRRVEGQSLHATADLCKVSLATTKRRIKEADARVQRRLSNG